MRYIPKEELLKSLEVPEGSISLIYGTIRNGKTTEAVRRMIDALEEGRTVISNIPLKLEGLEFDDRFSFRKSLRNILLFRSIYYRFSPKNYHYVDLDSNFDGSVSDLVDFLNKQTDCLIVWDEGWYLLDSYEKTNFSKAKRQLGFHTGHMGRELIIVSQRYESIQVSVRSQVSRFYKCEKLSSWPFIRFQVTEFQHMISGDVDETKPEHVERHFASKKVFSAFDTHFLRGDLPSSQVLEYEAWEYSFMERLSLLFSLFPLMRKERKERALKKRSKVVGGQIVATTIKNSKRLNTVAVGGKVSVSSNIKTETLPF